MEYYFKEGCYIDELHNSVNDEQLSVARVRVVAQSETKLHSLNNTTERYLIESGEGKVTVGDKSWQVGGGDIVLIPPGIAQKIKNSSGRDLVFLALCTPRFKVENYLDLA